MNDLPTDFSLTSFQEKIHGRNTTGTTQKTILHNTHYDVCFQKAIGDYSSKTILMCKRICWVLNTWVLS